MTGLGRVETRRVVLFDRGRPARLDSGATPGARRGRLRDLRHARRRRRQRGPRLPRADRGRERRGAPRRPGAPGLVGHADRPGQAGRHRPVLRRLAEPARRLPRHDRARVGRPRDGTAVRPGLPAADRARPQYACTAGCSRTSGSAARTRRIGGSLGGMQALQWALDEPGEVERAVLVCASARLSAQNIALSAAARAAILRDPGLRRRRAPRAGGRPDGGARHLPLRGGDAPQVRPRAARRRRGADDAGRRLRGRALPRPPGRGLPRALRRAQLPLPHARHGLLRAVRRRRAAPRRRARPALPAGVLRHATGASAPRTPRTSPASWTRWRHDVRHETVASPWGHDSFLLAVPAYHDLVRAFLAEGAPAGETRRAATLGWPGPPCRFPTSSAPC